jgi:transposase
MEAYSQDLRERVLRAIERGDRPSEIARRFEVSRVWVYQVRTRWQTQHLRTSLRIGGHRVSRLAPHEQTIRGWIRAAPDLTLEELRLRLFEQGLETKIGALWHQLNKWGLSFKKNSQRQRARQARREAEA